MCLSLKIFSLLNCFHKISFYRRAVYIPCNPFSRCKCTEDFLRAYLTTLFFSPFYSMTRRRPISRRLAFVLRFNIVIGRNNGPIASHRMGEPSVYFSFSRSYVHISRFFLYHSFNILSISRKIFLRGDIKR